MESFFSYIVFALALFWVVYLFYRGICPQTNAKLLFLLQDSQGHTFATRMAYIFVIGKGSKPYISLPRGNGIKLSVAEERDKRIQQRN